MKNRTWLPLALDYLGMIALLVAAVALGSALYLAGSAAEAAAFSTFKLALMTGVAALVVARISEISRLLNAEQAPQAQLAAPDNVEPLHEHLPRAA